MIKRRFYKHDHGDRDVPSDSSSSSDSELEAEAAEISEEEEEDDDVAVAQVRHDEQPGSSSSGYESEDSSANEVDLDSSGLPTNEDAIEAGSNKKHAGEIHRNEEDSAKLVDLQVNIEAKKDTIPSDIGDCVLQSKSVFRCKICPRIVCLTEETLKAHLKSKRHSRSEKLLKEGRLKLMLNSDGEIEGETWQDRRHASIAPSAQSRNSDDSKKKNRGRQRQRQRKMERVKKKTGDDSTLDNTQDLAKKPAKKQRAQDSAKKPAKKKHKM